VVEEVVWRQFPDMLVVERLAFGESALWSSWVLVVGSLEISLTRHPSWRLLCEGFYGESQARGGLEVLMRFE
jgi:hypothetical protein